MTEPREIRVKLTADVDDYIAEMKRATTATKKLDASPKRILVANTITGTLLAVIALDIIARLFFG